MLKIFQKKSAAAIALTRPPLAETADNEPSWLTQDEEGQLAVDVFQTPEEIIIKSTMAGAKAEDLEISVNHDMLTIKGRREMGDDVDYQYYLYRECYWGKFSRTIILPITVLDNKIKANLENGVLTIVLPIDKKSVGGRVVKVKQK